jgi:hypothetical protein
LRANVQLPTRQRWRKGWILSKKKPEWFYKY